MAALKREGKGGVACAAARQRVVRMHEAYTRDLPAKEADVFHERIGVLVQEARLIDAHAKERQSAWKYYNYIAFLVATCTVIVTGVMLHRVSALRNLFHDEFVWYEKAFVKGTLRPGAMNKSVDVYEVAMCITYNEYYRLGFVWSRRLEITLPAAKFLINMLRVFPDDITALNWCGSAVQLGQSQFLAFIGGNEANVGDDTIRWTQWLNEDNKWKFLFKNASQLSHSLAYTRIRKGIETFVDMTELLEGNMLYGLYSNGGLVQAAVNYTSKRESLNEADLMYELIGEHVTFKQSCDLARAKYEQSEVGSLGVSGIASQFSGAQGAAARNINIGMMIGFQVIMPGPAGLIWGGFACLFHGLFNHKPPCPPPTTYVDPRIDPGADEPNDPPG